MKVTFPYWGHYTPAITILFEKLGFDVIAPEKTNQTSIREGARISPELFCFPLKVNMGNYVSSLRRGADTIFMWENLGGICRFRYYWIIQQKALNDAGFKAKIINLNTSHPISRIREIKRINKISWFKILDAFYSTFSIIRFIERLEKKAAYFRPRETTKGETDKVLDYFFNNIGALKTRSALRKLKKKTLKKLKEIKIIKNKDVIKIGILGEIFMVTDNIVNFDLEKKLGQMGMEVHRDLSLSYFLRHEAFPWLDYIAQKRVYPYLKTTVGGHGRDAVNEMLVAVKKRLDGVVHILPLACMPEVTVRPILEKIHKEKKIPFLSLSLDEQVAEAGIQTRLEAFSDVVNNYHNKKNT
jgi:predicted nucleotide-binding protein (sugar kinase/HSP70/actin superfamily)